MNKVEMLQCQIALMARRLEGLEKRLMLAEPASDDVAQASMICAELGMDPVIIVQCDRLNERMKLAHALKAREWAYERIANSMRCCEKSVRRWVKIIARPIVGI